MLENLFDLCLFVEISRLSSISAVGKNYTSRLLLLQNDYSDWKKLFTLLSSPRRVFSRDELLEPLLGTR